MATSGARSLSLTCVALVTAQVTTVLRVVASVFDVVIINRYNIAIGISDKVMYMAGDNILYQVAYMLVRGGLVVCLFRCN